MSYTQGQHIAAHVHELGLNDLFRVICTARPHYLQGSYKIFNFSFSIPTVDVTPGGPAVLPAAAGQFVLRTVLTVQNISGSLAVLALCEPVVSNSPPGFGTIGIALKAVEFEYVTITPPSVAQLVKKLISDWLTEKMKDWEINFKPFTFDLFTLKVNVNLLAGPLAENDSIKVRGNVL